MQGLAINRPSQHTRLSHGFDSLVRAHVDKVDRTACLARQSEDPPERHILRQVAVDVVHVPPVPLPVLLGVIVIEMHHVVVFGMDEQNPTRRLDLLHDERQPTEVGLVVLHLRTGGPYRGGEYLEARKALLHQFRYLTDGFARSAVRENRMVRIVGVGVAFPPLRRLSERVPQIVARHLSGEVQNRGRPAPNGRLRHWLSARTLRLARTADVRVRFNTARHDDLPRSVYNPRVAMVHGSRRGNRRNALAGYKHVQIVRPVRRYH